MELLELFAGTRSIWKVAEKYWYKVTSVENDEKHKCNLTMSVLDFYPIDFDIVPDVIWASPPCTTFSIASCSTHRNKDRSPKTKEAELWDELVMHTLVMIEEYIEHINPNVIWFIENPRWLLRKMPWMIKYIEKLWWVRHTVTYCQYWDNRMKPTDIWTNSKTWTPKKMCKNWDSCHESAPRWSKTWTQWIKWAKNRSIIPEQLCTEIILSTLCQN